MKKKLKVEANKKAEIIVPEDVVQPIKNGS